MARENLANTRSNFTSLKRSHASSSSGGGSAAQASTAAADSRKTESPKSAQSTDEKPAHRAASSKVVLLRCDSRYTLVDNVDNTAMHMESLDTRHVYCSDSHAGVVVF